MCDPATAMIISSAIGGGAQLGSGLLGKHKGGVVPIPASPQPLKLPAWPASKNGLSGSAISPLNTMPPMSGLASKDPFSILPLLASLFPNGG